MDAGCTRTIAGSPVRLKAPFDFGFLERYGSVVKLIDNGPGSGNICLCIEKGGKKYFAKFAGAWKEKFDFGTPELAVQWLKDAKQIYTDLAHDCLIKFVKGEEVGGGFINIFEWVDAECIGYPSPASRKRYLDLPADKKLRSFETILDFHLNAAKKGYVAIDFYADQILYDFENDRTIICDIDFYQRSPYYGDKGGWGSANFVSPEECSPGSRIDEVTMVYTMGATAFSIFADYDRSREAWGLNRARYDVAKRAVSDERDLRQGSIAQFMDAWHSAGQ